MKTTAKAPNIAPIAIPSPKNNKNVGSPNNMQRGKAKPLGVRQTNSQSFPNLSRDFIIEEKRAMKNSPSGTRMMLITSKIELHVQKQVSLGL